jgi:predicted SAM-dependent methyltransferase
MTSNLSTDNHSIYNNIFQLNLQRLFTFEITSLYGRLFLQKKPPLKLDGKNLLNLGYGKKNKIEGWVNADFFPSLKFWKKDNNKIPDWMLDLRYPLNCNNNVWDGVFSEHTIEHLYPIEVLNLLKELNRTMKFGAWLRITVPDLEKYVSYYGGKQVNEEFLKWTTGCEAIHSLTQNYGHKSVWDRELLGNFLEKAGFINIKEVSYMQGTDKLLLLDQEMRKWETLYMEAQKPNE